MQIKQFFLVYQHFQKKHITLEYLIKEWQAFVSSSEPLLTFSEAHELEKQNLPTGDFKIVKEYESNTAKSTYYLISNE